MFSDTEELNYKLLCEGKIKEKQVQAAQTKLTPPSSKDQLFLQQETVLKQELNQNTTFVEPIVKFPDFKNEANEGQVDTLLEKANILIRTTESFGYEIQEMELPRAVILKSELGHSKEAEISSYKARKSYQKLLNLLNKRNS